jgi:pantetheine-phosphate adenylyltransferase
MEVVRKAARLFDEVVVAVYATPNKLTAFDPDERLALVRAAVEELGLANVRARTFDSLVVELAREEGAVALVKGLRAVSDFDYELQMAHMNEQLVPEVVTVAVLAGADYTFLSSTLVRDVARHGGDVSRWVPAAVAARLRERFGPPSTGVSLQALVPDAEGGADRIGGFVVHDERVR